MAMQKEYKIAQLSYLDGISPAITYINGNKKFNTMEEANSKKPKDNRDTIYLVIELSNMQNNLRSAKLA